MTILASQLKMYKAETVNDLATNGGRCSANEVVTGAAQNVFEHVFRSDRVAGLTRYRKVFYRNENTSNETAYNGQPFFHHPPGGDHYLWWHVGTYDDTQDDLTGSERKYGSAFLSSAASSGASTLVVTVKNAAETAKFVDGDPIIVSGKSTPSSSTGNEELHTISGTPVVASLQVTITIAGTLANSYAADTTSVTSGMTAADIECSVSDWAESFAGTGAWDETTYPVECDNLGTVYDDWTGTFDGSGNIAIVGAAEGSLGTFSLASDIEPENTNKSNYPYFTLRVAGLSGTPQSGDTISWTTNPAEVPVWETLTVPANAEPLGSAGFYSYLDIETA